MLIHVVEKFVIKPKFWNIPEDNPVCLSEFGDYRHDMINDDYLCRNNCLIYKDQKNHSLYVAGILGHPDALKDARSNPRMSRRFSEISDQISSRTVQYSDICPDYQYCEHKKCKSLILVADHVFGLPSLICSECGGLIAKYRLSLSKQTNSMLWSWERQHDAIDSLSSLCLDYESWADGEIYNIRSKINQLGLSVGRNISDGLNRPVYYLFDTGENVLHDCPQCSAPLKPSLFSKRHDECSICKILLGNS